MRIYVKKLLFKLGIIKIHRVLEQDSVIGISVVRRTTTICGWKIQIRFSVINTIS